MVRNIWREKKRELHTRRVTDTCSFIASYPLQLSHSHPNLITHSNMLSPKFSLAEHLLLSLHINIRASRALIPLRRHNLIIMASQGHSLLCPRIKVILHIDTPATALSLANAPVLLERAGAVDAGLVDARAERNVVGAAVGGDGSLALRVGGRVVGAVGFDDVVFDEGVACPAVDGEVTVSLRGEGAAVVDGAGGC